MLIGLSSMIVSGVKPFSKAAANTKGLNAEPGCLSACAARLNWSVPRPPTIALTYPVLGSIATSAP